jgi:hypothetical protein
MIAGGSNGAGLRILVVGAGIEGPGAARALRPLLELP